MKNLTQFAQNLSSTEFLANKQQLNALKGGVDPTMTDAPIDCRTISVPVDIVIEN